jgi:uncharacterized protein YfaS (alpha-2-macroglobulin family)
MRAPFAPGGHTMHRLTGILTLLALPALAQDFDTANRHLQERSDSRACDGFTAFLKASPSSPLAREASAKKAAACFAAGRGNSAELRALATTGEKDFARAFAAFTLFERGGEGELAAVTALLKQAAAGDGRTAREARALCTRAGFVEMERRAYDLPRLEAAAQLVLEFADSEADRARAKLLRSTRRLQFGGAGTATAEKELTAVGAGATEWADDAVFTLAERRENEGQYEAALTLYDSIVSRFSEVTSNRHANARERAGELRRASLSISIPTHDVPGVTQAAQLAWRNVASARWTLRKVDPLAARAGDFPDEAGDLAAFDRGVVKTWTTALEVPTRHAPGSKRFELAALEPGAYVLEVEAEGQRARDWFLVTQTAVLTKSDARSVLVYVADVETGEAKAGADVALFIARNDGQNERRSEKTGPDGIARFDVKAAEASMIAWARSGSSVACATAGNVWRSSRSRERLAYVMTDRPLYQPGETVGFKVFLRSREGGASTPLPNTTVKLLVSDPTGKQVAEPTLTTNAFGTAHVTLPLPKSAPLGAWSAYVRSDDEGFHQPGQSFRVEEFKPPEYSVSVEPLGASTPGQPVKARVKAAFYSGGPVANAQGRAIVSLTPWTHRFGPWPDATLEEDDERAAYEGRHRGYHRGPVSLGQHTLTFKTGADGTADLELPAAPPEQLGVQYQVQIFLTDASRREVTGSGTLRVTTAPYFVDARTTRLLYRPGEKVTVELRGEDANGRAASPDVVVRLSRMAEDGTARRVGETRTKLKDGAGRVVLDADAIGMARVEVLDAADASDRVLASSDFWLTSDTRPAPPPGSGLQLLVDSAPLRAGSSVRVLVAAPRPGGHVLLTLESDVLHEARVVELQGRARFVELPVRAELSPNAWLAAARFDDGRALTQQRAVRVAGGDAELDVRVDFGQRAAQPGSPVRPTVSATGAAPGTPTEVSFSVVDEALFAIEPEHTNFLPFFRRSQRQLAVRTSFSHAQRAYRVKRPVQESPPEPLTAGSTSETSGGARKKLANFGAAPGSGTEGEASAERASAAAPRSESKLRMRGEPDEGAEAPVAARSDFASSAGWFPALTSKTGATLVQPVSLKDSLTSWKAIATVVTTGPHLGQGAGRIRTSKPLMVRLQAPRFFIEGDEVTLSAVVESHLPAAADVEVVLAASGFKPLSDARRVVRVAPEQVVRVDAKFKVVALGERLIRAQVKGGGSADAMEWTLPAFVHGSAQRQAFAGRLGDRFGFEFELPEKRKPALTRVELTFSPSLLSVMFDGLPSLAQYPYGCVEQTLSRFVPATIARRAVTDLRLPAARVPKDLDDMVQKGLARLSEFQHSDGGWGWWREDDTNDWMTAYVVYALSLAREAGVAVDAAVVLRGRDALTRRLGAALNVPETHAFMVYALATTGGAPKPALDAVYQRRTTLTPRARAQLALSLLAAKDPRARVAVENLDDVVKVATERKDAMVGDATTAWSTSAAIEATAFTLMAYTRFEPTSPLIGPLTDFLVLRRNGGLWRTTRDTAFAIYALSDLARREDAPDSAGTFVVSVNGREIRRVRYASGGLDLTAPLVLGDADLQPGQNVVTVTRDGRGTGYFAATVDVFNMNDFIRGVGGDVKVKRTYTLLGRPSADQVQAPTEYGMPVESGVRVRVDLELTATKAVEFVMVEDLKPAGFEAVEQRSGRQVCNFACAHAELRTDRVAMFLPSLPVGTTKLSYELRAEVPGRFAALPARFEAMYAPELQATADEMRFEVRDAPEAGVAVTP